MNTPLISFGVCIYKNERRVRNIFFSSMVSSQCLLYAISFVFHIHKNSFNPFTYFVKCFALCCNPMQMFGRWCYFASARFQLWRSLRKGKIGSPKGRFINVHPIFEKRIPVVLVRVSHNTAVQGNGDSPIDGYFSAQFIILRCCAQEMLPLESNGEVFQLGNNVITSNITDNKLLTTLENITLVLHYWENIK